MPVSGDETEAARAGLGSGLGMSSGAMTGVGAGAKEDATDSLTRREALSVPLRSDAVSGAVSEGLLVSLRPRARLDTLPDMRWDHQKGSKLWTRGALAAMRDHGRPLTSMVPRDIQTWCPAYPTAGPDQRAAFWVGFMSALSKHESTYRPWAVGGGGLWYGLLQILPSTARLYDCRARTGEALKDGPANLSCAIRIMARTVPRDGVIHEYTKAKKRRWRGVSADWGPMRSEKKRADMAHWLRAQDYCKPKLVLRPKLRPADLTTARLIEASDVTRTVSDAQIASD
ncbi:lytic transglycosylase [Rhodalgimonas zhirmunskyi]|uniref:Lytic transglycosylase n=1 Tax=Rhodalgimonas zhirmunskyi TaxID=2964767 RepID=A0AAJ1UG25_9RHOB|nr:lytic transglycosylase [Rhodoalgimonas zhirmunskyi]MDQ2095426.1 lytic transglycosylase [Rhodoalgimonas zhirmunskyi]